MKKIVILIFTILAIVSCDSPRVKGKQIVKDRQTISSAGDQVK